MRDGEKIKPYGLHKRFERVVAATAATNERFWLRVGFSIEPEAMSDPQVALILKAVRQIATELGRGPSDDTIVLQRLTRWREDGKVTHEEVMDAADMIGDVLDAGIPDIDAIVNEMTEVVKRHKLDDAVRQAIVASSKKDEDMAEVAQSITEALQIGTSEEMPTIAMGTQMFARIRDVRETDRMPTGVGELDDLLDGGMARGQLGFVIGGPGDGKSMFLNQAAGAAVANGFNVAVATLELSDAEWGARFAANMSNIPINAVKSDESAAELRYMARQAAEGLGMCLIREFTPHATRVEEITAWVKEEERQRGMRIDVLLVDYADKLAWDTRTATGAYEGMRLVYEGLRLWAHQGKRWCWSASQAKRKDKKGHKRYDLDDAADSQHKVRVTDLAITTNVADDMVEYYVGKNRTGVARVTAGPMPTDFAYGRLACIPEMSETAADAIVGAQRALC